MATFRTTDGVTLAFTDTGDGPPVVLIAGFTAPATSWALQTPALLAAGYRVIGWDRRSHGASEEVAHGQRISRHGKDLAELLDHLQLTDVVLIGGSMGGNVIWAHLDLFGTERVRAAVIVDQTPAMINDDTWPHGFYGLTRANAGTYFDGGIPDTGHGPDPAVTAAGLALLVEATAGDLRWANAADPSLKPLLLDHASLDWRDVIARLDIPALFVAGRQSQLWPADHAAASAALADSADFVVLENCGHAANMDQSAAFNAAVLEFLSR